MRLAEEDFVGPEVLDRLIEEAENTPHSAQYVALLAQRFGRRWIDVYQMVRERMLGAELRDCQRHYNGIRR